ncbi:MAG: ankyrin repeat domain-containing protein [Rickettsiales bacterium]
MTFIMHSPFDLLSPSQQVINLLTETDKTLSGSKHTEEERQKYRRKATELINQYSAEKLFEPDERLGKNVLHYAISTGNPIIAIDLINKAGVTSEQLFHQDTDGYTPLHDAIDKGAERVAINLIRKATTSGQLQCMTHVHGDHKTAMQMAEDKSITNVVRDLKNRIKVLSAGTRPNRFQSRYRTNQQSSLGI